MSDKPTPDRSSLHLTDTKNITLDHVLNLFRRLTGREPTLEEVEKARRRWDAKRKPSPD